MTVKEIAVYKHTASGGYVQVVARGKMLTWGDAGKQEFIDSVTYRASWNSTYYTETAKDFHSAYELACLVTKDA